MTGSAIISACGKYRYTLERYWDAMLPMCGFVMLNPSTADASLDDPTIRRCISFAKREGCGGIQVVNLFAYRATDPAELRFAEDPFGPMNDLYLRSFFDTIRGPVIAAWGSNAAVTPEVVELARQMAGRRMQCLGKTQNGSPRHPLYVKGDTPLIPF